MDKQSLRVDAHQHFWHYSPAEYDWIDAPMAALQRDHLPHDLRPELNSAAIDGVISVQARQSLAETQWLLSLAEQHGWIWGVVGWAPIALPAFPAMLEQLLTHRRLKGLRHVVQAEADPEFLLREPFASGIRRLAATELVYDLLVLTPQLPQAIRFVDAHPNQKFVLDHLAKPPIATGVLEPWHDGLRELARRPNVFCKLSGMVTEAKWAAWTLEDLKPYVEAALRCFGPARLMMGSDWPVCTLASSYGRWMDTLRTLLASLSHGEQARIFGGTAMDVYQLSAD